MKKKSKFFSWLKKHAKKGVLAAVLAVMLLSPCFAFLGHSKSYNADAFYTNNAIEEFLPWGGETLMANVNNTFSAGGLVHYYYNEFPSLGSSSTGNYGISWNCPYLGYSMQRSSGNNTDYFEYSVSSNLMGRYAFNDLGTSITWMSINCDSWIIEINSFLEAIQNSYLAILSNSTVNRLEFFESCLYNLSGRIYDKNGNSHSIDWTGYKNPNLSVTLNRLDASLLLSTESFSACRLKNMDLSVTIDNVVYDITDESTLRENFIVFTNYYDFLYFESFQFRIATPATGFPTVDPANTYFYFRYNDMKDTYLSSSIIEHRDYLTYKYFNDYKSNVIYDFTRPILNFVEGFFNMEIFPNFRISYMILLGVGAIIFGFVLKFFLGG